MKLSKDKTLGYIYFVDKNNHLANSQGKVYYHRYIYWLNTKEDISNFDIHHKDGNKENNNFSNLIKISRSDHAKLHNPLLINNKHICKECKKEFIRSSQSNENKKPLYCSKKCNYLSKRKLKIRPSYKELLLIIRFHGFKFAGRKYNVSDNCIRKWIKFYENVSEQPSKL